MDYYDFFNPQPHIDGEVSMDEFIASAMRKNIKFENESVEQQYIKSSRDILIDELLTCYSYLNEKGLIREYQKYRNGEEPEDLPFN